MSKTWHKNSGDDARQQRLHFEHHEKPKVPVEKFDAEGRWVPKHKLKFSKRKK